MPFDRNPSVDSLIDLIPAAPEFAGPRPAVLVFPGGAYRFHAPHEGLGVAHWLASIGVHAFHFRYPFPSGLDWPGPLVVARRALAWVRDGDHGLAVSRVGVFGASAGGHLAGLLATGAALSLETASVPDGPENARTARADRSPETQPRASSSKNAQTGASPGTEPRASSSKTGASPGTEPRASSTENSQAVENHLIKPDFSILAYAVADLRLLPDAPLAALTNGRPHLRDELSPGTHIAAGMGPVFAWCTLTDPPGLPNTLELARLCAAAGVSCEVHVFPEGWHGLGLADGVSWGEAPAGERMPPLVSFPHTASWAALCERWLREVALQ